MKILVLGSGGREHALAWKIAQSPRCDVVFIHPGNAGHRLKGFKNLPSTPNAPRAIADTAKKIGISLIVIGPEALLAQGYADFFRQEGFQVVGPNQNAAQVETSKVFAKQFMERAGIPTASYFVVNHASELIHQLSENLVWPVVLKLDGLAAGKGVTIAKNVQDVRTFAKQFSTERVIIERFISGKELSYIGLCDGKHFIPLSSATDYKRIGDGNSGPNTGGMGSISPSPYFSVALETKIRTQIAQKLLSQFQKEQMDYRGALYIGIIVDDKGEPFVLEFNARFGDPETQAILLRLKSDFVELLKHTAEGSLEECLPLQWEQQPSVYVVGAAKGYPESPVTGASISGVNAIDSTAQLFYSGVEEREGNLVTSGGRVLGIGAMGADFNQAREKAYRNIRKIHWDGIKVRSDIGIIEEEKHDH